MPADYKLKAFAASSLFYHHPRAADARTRSPETPEGRLPDLGSQPSWKNRGRLCSAFSENVRQISVRTLNLKMPRVALPAGAASITPYMGDAKV